MQPRKPSFMEKELIKDLRRCTETRADLLEALDAVSIAHAHIESANMPEWLDKVEQAIEKAK